MQSSVYHSLTLIQNKRKISDSDKNTPKLKKTVTMVAILVTVTMGEVPVTMIRAAVPVTVIIAQMTITRRFF